MEQIIAQNKKWIDEVWEKLDKKLKVVSEASKDKIPYTTKNGVHDDKMTGESRDVCWWTNGFWPGMMWLMYVGTKDERYKKVAERAEELLDNALADFDGLHHDVGFMWHISAGMNYRLTGNKKSRLRALYAANTLAGRFNTQGGYIRAWNGEDVRGWAIIDCMMNIPLLYWASDEIGDDRYRFVAMKHADKTMENHIRPDGSSHHIVEYNPVTGEFVQAFGGQGYELGSSWSRGQAWALYGFVLSFIHTGKQEYLDTAKRVANYFIAALGDDFVPKCDFRQPAEPVIYDTTAGTIAACGLIEIAKNVPEYEKAMYLNAAIKILKATDERFCDYTTEEQSIVQDGTEAYHAEHGIHIPIIYGDYYFIEAIYKLKGFEPLFW